MYTKQKKIMHLIATNFYGGPEKQIVEHLTRLNSDRFNGFVASFLEGNSPNEILAQAKLRKLKCYGIPMSGPLDFKAFSRLSKLAGQEKIDLLCTHGYKSSVMGYWLRRKARIPVLAFSRGYTAENKKIAFYEWLERQILGRLEGIICVSWGQLKKLESLGVRYRQKWVVWNAVAVKTTMEEQTTQKATISQRLNIPPNAKMVVTAGRLSPEKGHRFFIDAIKKLSEKSSEEVSSAYFIFCGDGACKKDLEGQAKKLGIEKKCRFIGFRQDIIEIFSVMDLMVLPSLTEGLPNVILEAFACSKPVVATSVGGVPEVVEDGINGFLVPPSRHDLIAGAIEKLLSNPELRQTMGQAGYSKVKTQFSFESQTHKLEAIYHEILG